MKIPCYRNRGLGLLILRLFVGGIFIVHGVQKLLHIEDTINFFSQINIPAFFAWLVAIVETVGGIALVIGMFVQYASILLSIILLVAIVKVKWVFGGDTLLGKFAAGEIDLALLGACLALVFTGAGKLSLSRWCRCKCHGANGNCGVCKIVGCHTAGKCEGGHCDGEHKEGSTQA
jgi:putative oxidoreductase